MSSHRYDDPSASSVMAHRRSAKKARTEQTETCSSNPAPEQEQEPISSAADVKLETADSMEVDLSSSNQS